MATDGNARVFSFVGGVGTDGPDSTQPGSTPPQAGAGAPGTSTKDKHNNYTCTKQPGKGQPGQPGGPGNPGGPASRGLDSPGGSLDLGKVSGAVVIETGGGNGGKGGHGAPGGTGGAGGPAGSKPQGCSPGEQGTAGAGGRGGDGGPGGDGGDAGQVLTRAKGYRTKEKSSLED